MNRQAIINQIIHRRIIQDKKHPEFPEHLRMAILAEETGEVGTALQNGDRQNLKDELYDVICTAVRWLEVLETEEKR